MVAHKSLKTVQILNSSLMTLGLDFVLGFGLRLVKSLVVVGKWHSENMF